MRTDPRLGYDSRIDWLQFSELIQGDGDKRKLFGELRVVFDELLADAKQYGFPVILDPWSYMGGYKGFTIGSFRWGRDKTPRGLLVASSDWAHKLALHASSRYLRQVSDWRCSRLDLAVDVRLSDGVRCLDWLESEYRAVLAASASIDGPKPAIDAVMNDGYLATVYIGKPSSDRRLAIYDKGLESVGIPGVHVRYESRWRRALSDEVKESVMADLADAPRDGEGRAGADWHRGVAAMVSAEFNRRGAVGLRGLSQAHVVAPSLAPRAGNVDKTLDWIREAVVPAIEKLLDAGLTPDQLNQATNLVDIISKHQ